jgi:hypothetical protein
MRGDSGFCVAPSELNKKIFVVIHALTGVAIECRPFGPVPILIYGVKS